MIIRGWRVFVPVVLVHAAVQALLVVADPVPALDAGFLALLAASAVAVLLATWLTLGSVAARTAGGTARRPRPTALLWVLVVGVAAVAASLLATWLLPVVLALDAFLLPVAATGDGNPVAGAWRTIRHAPVRAVLLVLAALVVAAVSVVVALLLGFFVTGWMSAGLLWVWLGAAGTVLLGRYCALAARVGAPGRAST